MEKEKKEDIVGSGDLSEKVTGCSHLGKYSLAGMSSHRDENGDIVHFISLFCTECGEMSIKLTKLEVDKKESDGVVKEAEEVKG